MEKGIIYYSFLCQAVRYSYRMQKKDSLNWAMASVIYEARKASGLTQVELADFSGLSKPYVSGLERGNINASVFALVRVAEVLKVSPAELMARVERKMEQGPSKPQKETGRPKN